MEQSFKSETALTRFLRYVSFSTASDPNSAASPSTPGQFALLRQLEGELLALGAAADFDRAHGVLYASIPEKGAAGPALGFIAHVDTSPDAPGEGVRPQIVRYTGAPVVLGQGLTLSEEEFPELAAYRGSELITTDGSTLLGADDKAGVAEIMTLAAALLAPDAPPHCAVKLAFTPDEEIGRGTSHFDLARFGADFAYTVDGGRLGEIQYENFNAAGARVTIRGKSVHPGSAKGVMVNAAALALEFHALLPKEETPERTEGYEGFFHLHGIAGGCETCTLDYLVRDHDRVAFERRKEQLKEAAATLNRRLGEERVTVELQDSYYNMKEKIMPHFHLVEDACAAFRACGVEPVVEPIRGGTDGAMLSYQGLPCPNLSTGGHNFHGRLEYLPLPSLLKMPEVLLKLVTRSSHVL